MSTACVKPALKLTVSMPDEDTLRASLTAGDEQKLLMDVPLKVLGTLVVVLVQAACLMLKRLSRQNRLID